MAFKRKTIVSENVLKILERSTTALSVTQLIQLLEKKNIRPNKTTLYRIIDKLKENSLIHVFTLNNGTSYFELKDNHHHHHFFCNQCEKVICLNTCHLSKNNNQFEDILPNQNFSIDTHEFNIYGLCDKCTEPQTTGDK